VRGRQRESRFCRTETAARWTKKAARIIQQVTLQDRPRQGSQTAFSVATRCTSVRRCLIRALIKSREREREREREGVASPWRVRDSGRIKVKRARGTHRGNRKRARDGERGKKFSSRARRGRINYLRGGEDRSRLNLDMNRGNRANGTRFADSEWTRKREGLLGPRIEKLKSQHKLRDRICGRFSGAGAPALVNP